MRTILFSALLLALAAWDQTQAAPYTPKAGSPERVAICDALRVHLAKEWADEKIPQGEKIIFVIDWLKVDGDFAFFTGSPAFEKGGKEVFDYIPPVDYAFLLQRKAGVWRVFKDFSTSDAPPPDYWTNCRKSFPKEVSPGIFSDYFRHHLGM